MTATAITQCARCEGTINRGQSIRVDRWQIATHAFRCERGVDYATVYTPRHDLRDPIHVVACAHCSEVA
jgi:hypothetical protein